MSKRGSGVPLGERCRPGDTPAAARPAADPAGECPARHCWVADAVDRHGVKRPGLLVEWRRTSTAWQGRVLYAASLRPGEWVVVEEWLPGELISPA